MFLDEEEKKKLSLAIYKTDWIEMLVQRERGRQLQEA